MKIIVLSLLLYSSGVSAASYARYYCFHGGLKKFAPAKVSSFDEIIIISRKGNKTTLSSGVVWGSAVFSHVINHKIYDEGNRIISVYKDIGSAYKIVVIDNIYSGTTTFSYGYGYHYTKESFEKSYQIPFTKKNIKYINKNPEMIKYLPKKPDPKMISVAFLRSNKKECERISRLQSIYRAIILSFAQLLSVG